MFKVKLEEGYVLTSAGQQDQVAWQEENVTVNFNGERIHFMQGGVKYADGYFVTEYYMDGADTVEIHVLWYGVREADYDISDKKVGETVNIPDSAFDYDGYFVYKYVLSYTEPSGVTHFDNISGKSFVMPKSDADGVKLMVKYLRGDGKTALQQINKDASGHIELNVDNAEFPSNTVVNVNKVEKSEDGQKHQIVESALAGAKDYVVFDIVAYAYNMKVQPDGRVLVTFPLPSGFDAEHLAFYYISQDGQCVELALQMKDKNTGTAVLGHFSMYAIVKTDHSTDNNKHVIHIVAPVPQKDATCTENGHISYFECGCGKKFSDINAENELDESDITLLAGHTDENVDGVCDDCGEGDISSEELKPQTTATIDAPTATPSLAPGQTEDQDRPGEGSVQPTVEGTRQPDKQNGAPILPIAIGVVVLIAIAVIILVIKKRAIKK